MAEVFEFPGAKRGPPVNEDERHIADLRHADGIDAMMERCSGLEMAIMGANHISGGELNGVSRLASDLVQWLRQLAIAFEGERQLRIEEEAQMTTKPKTRKAPAVAKALARAKKAQAAYEAAAAASAASPDDENLSNIMGDLCAAETDAYDELENTPCASDEEFLEKLKYMIAHEVHIFGSPFESRAEFGPVVRAAALHFGAGTAA